MPHPVELVVKLVQVKTLPTDTSARLAMARTVVSS
jgi:hypothetical protein